VRLAAITGGLWAALALAPAHVFVIAWTRGRAERVAILPEPAWVLGAFAVTVAGLVAMGIVWRLRGGALHDLARAASPLAWLTILVVPFLPGAADLFPALGILAGPFRWVLVGGAVLWHRWRLTPCARRSRTSIGTLHGCC
jgi:hypothetical protein